MGWSNAEASCLAGLQNLTIQFPASHRYLDWLRTKAGADLTSLALLGDGFEEDASLLQLCSFLEVASLLFPGLRRLGLSKVWIEAVVPSISRFSKLESLILIDVKNSMGFVERGGHTACLGDLRRLRVSSCTIYNRIA